MIDSMFCRFAKSKLLPRLYNCNSIIRQQSRVSVGQQVSLLHSSSRRPFSSWQRQSSIATQHGISCQYAVQRCCSSSSVSLQGSRNRDVTLNKDSLSLRYGHYHLDLPYVWLRDHCRCDVCYNHKTCQKNIDNYDLDLDISPTQVAFDGTVLTLECNSTTSNALL